MIAKRKTIIALLLTVLMSVLLSSCNVFDGPRGREIGNKYFWLADPSISCHMDKCDSKITVSEGTTKTIYLVFGTNVLNEKCSMKHNGKPEIDVTPKSEDDRFTPIDLEPGMNFITVKILDRGFEDTFKVELKVVGYPQQ